MIIPLFVLAFDLAPTGAQNWLEIAANIQGGVDQSPRMEETRAEWSSMIGAADVGVTVFLGHALTDDDGPLSLQPFLQRTLRLHLSCDGRGFTGDWRVDGSVVEHRTGSGRSFAASIDGYAGTYLYLKASFAAVSESWQNEPAQPFVFPTSHSSDWLPVQTALGLRLGDITMSAGWTFTPRRDDGAAFSVEDWRQLSADVHAIIRRRFELEGEVTALRGGIALSGYGEVFFARSLGVWLNAFDSRTTTDEGRSHWAGGSLGAAWWVSSRVKLSLEYGFTRAFYSMPARELTEHRLSLGTVIRLH